MVRQARQMVRDGALGEIRVVQVEYPQDWLTEKLEATGQKQAEWRTDPARTAPAARSATSARMRTTSPPSSPGCELDELCAELSSFVEGPRARRQRAGDAALRQRRARPAVGQPGGAGQRERPALRVYGSKGGLEWRQEHPNQLHWSPFGQPTQIIARATGAANAAAARVTRIPSGHPEGYLEGFATIYSEIAQAIRAARNGGPKADKAAHFPTLDDGVKGVAFIEAVVASSAKGGRWVRFKP